MFIAVVGTRRSGQKTIVEYLQSKGFVLLSVALGAGVRSTMSSQPESSINNNHVSLEFTSLSEMLVFATRNWRDNFVTLDITSIQDVEPFAKRPFFMLIGVDAPVLTRFRRGNHSSLENFLEEHDKLLYSVNALDPEPADSCMTKKSSLHELSRFVKLSIINDFETVQSLYQHLDFLNILDSDRLRPSWDSYFMTLASLASMRSNCMKRRVGAIIVREKRIVATGYNGTPRGLANCNEGGCAKCNGSATRNETCLCLHAEENALLEASRVRIAGATLYCNTCPCLTCTIKIVQVGVSEVVYNLSYKVDDASARLFQDAGVVLRRYAPPP